MAQARGAGRAERHVNWFLMKFAQFKRRDLKR
jgi:hypothetical protein